MIGLPRSTEFNRRIPKQKFYENLNVTSALKRVFIDQINTIWWRNKIAPATINIASGKEVTEIEVFELKLSASQLDESVLRLIDREIPYHILFLLEYEGKYQAWTAYKEAVESGKNAFKVGVYYHTDWMEEPGIMLRLDGLNMDQVYENFVRQIAGEILKIENEGSLKESVGRDAQRKQLEKQITVLQTKIRKEKQLNKQIQMNAEVKRLKKELEEL